MTTTGILIPALALLLAMVTPAHAQNELVANPKAVKLRRIWTLQGEFNHPDEVGADVAPLFDIDGNEANEFAVYRGSNYRWLFFKGGNPPDTIPFWTKDAIRSPIWGNFWGDGQRQLLLAGGRDTIVDSFHYYFDRFELYRTLAGHIDTVPVLEVDQGKKNPPINRLITQVIAANLDTSKGDEVVVIMDGKRVGYIREADARDQLWIYRGGSSFQLDTPTVVIYDTTNGRADNWQVRFADLDGDGHVDMIASGNYPIGGPMLKFWWGDASSPWSWPTRPSDRQIALLPQIGINPILSYSNLDGDGAMDLYGQVYSGDSAGTYVYLSSRGKSARTRSFRLDDADVYYHNAPLNYWTPAGYLNDSTRHYEMLPFSGTVDPGQIARRYVSGGPDGPNHSYEAWYAPGLDGLNNENVFPVGTPVGDVTGDGWDDILYGAYKYGVFVNTGIAFILAGGPYIPRDSLSLSVRDVAIAGRETGLSLWPNPVHEELNIAWSGDLKRMPYRFEVHDLLGQLIVSGEVTPHLGAALWRCADVPAGTYLLTAFDHDNNPIVTTTVIKQ